jgi:hypothetical protein
MAFIASPRKALKIVPERRAEKEKAEKEKANLHGLEKAAGTKKNGRD